MPSSTSGWRSSIIFPFKWACINSASVSVSPLTSTSSFSSTSGQCSQSVNSSTTTTTSSSSSPQFDSNYKEATTFSDLLQELKELEHNVTTLGKPIEKWKESVAVEKETEDPIGELRRSMMEMVQGKVTVSGSDMAELLSQFLAVNVPENHPLVIHAFNSFWSELFSGETPPPQSLLLHGNGRHHS